MKEVKKQRKKSTQALLGLQTFGKYGLKTEKGEAMSQPYKAVISKYGK